MATEKAILAGGCFWGMQDLIRREPGVISTRVGYSGGDVPNATYRNHGDHAEAIEIVFDPERDSATGSCWSSSSRSTTRPRRTGRATTSGASYRSAIFYTDDEQKQVARGHHRRRRRLRPVAGQGRHRGRPGRSTSGRPSRSTRTTWSATRTATPATSRARTGSCRGARRRRRQPSAADQKRQRQPRERGDDLVGTVERERRRRGVGDGDAA